MVVAGTGVDAGIEVVTTLPVATIRQAQRLRDVEAARAVLHRLLRGSLVDVAHGVGEGGARVRVDAPVLVRPHGRIEVKVGRTVPVAVDVNRLRDTSARHVVVLRAVGGGVLRGAELKVQSRGALEVGDAAAIGALKVVGERGFQLGVSKADVERVGVRQRVGYKVGDGGLTRLSVVAEFELLLAREHVAEVDVGRGIEDRAAHVVVFEPLLVVNLVDLRLQVGTDGEAIERAVDAKLHVDVVVLILVYGVGVLSRVGRSHVFPQPIIVGCYII